MGWVVYMKHGVGVYIKHGVGVYIKHMDGCLHNTYVVYELCSPDCSTPVNSHQVIYDRKFWQAFLGGSQD